MVFGFNSEKRNQKKQIRALQEATYSLILDFEAGILSKSDVSKKLIDLSKTDPDLFKSILPFIYHMLVTVHLSRIATEDKLYLQLKRIYNEGAYTEEINSNRSKFKLPSDIKGLEIIVKRLDVWTRSERFWYKLLSDIASSARSNFAEMLDTFEISPTKSLDHIEIPNAYVHNKSGTTFQT
jgi:hypothetical protein